MLAKESLGTILVLAGLVALGPMSTDMYLPALPAMTVAFGTDVDGYVSAGYGVLGTLGFGLAIPESLASKDYHAVHLLHVFKNFKTLLSHRLYMGYVLSCSFVYAGLFAFLSGSSFVVIEHFGVREEHFGLLFALVVFGYMGGTQSGARLSLRFGVDRLLGSGALLATAAGLLMALFALLPVDHLAAVIAPMMVYMVGVGMVMPQSMAGALAPFPHMAGAASAFLGFFQMTIAALVGVGVGHLHDGTPVAMATMIALMGLATLASFIVLVQRPAAKPQV